MTFPPVQQSVLGGVGSPGFLRDAAGAYADPYRRTGEGPDLSLLSAGKDFQRFAVDEDTHVVVRGVVALGAGETLLDRVNRLAAAYRETGRFSRPGWDGAYTVYLADAWKRKLVAYRSMVAPGFTYFAQTPRGCALAGNARVLARALNLADLNGEALPALFLFRTVPGRDTLFEGMHRLLPGECVEITESGARTERLETLADFRAPYDHPPVDALESAMERVVQDIARTSPQCTTLLSGGVDSSYLHVHRLRTPGGTGSPPSFSMALPHTLGEEEKRYAQTVAEATGHPHTFVSLDRPYAYHLIRAVQETGEVPNHVQAVYFSPLARAMAEAQAGLGLCGQGADALLGLGLVYDVMQAESWQRRLGGLSNWGAEIARLLGRRYLADKLRLAAALEDNTRWDHPVNRVGRWTHRPSVEASFGAQAVSRALARRRQLLSDFAAGDHPWTRIFTMDLVGEVMDSASLWTGLFEANGRSLAMPYLDSRVLRFAYSTPLDTLYPRREPKALLKDALSRHLASSLISRPKLAFSQPVFSWLEPSGPLSHLLDAVTADGFVDGASVDRARRRPNWFLYTLLCFDVWHKTYVEGRDLLKEHNLEEPPA